MDYGKQSVPKKDDSPARELIQRFDELKSDRAMFDSIFQEIRELIRPNADDFSKQIAGQGQAKRQRVWDDTATQALTSFSGGLHGHLTNPSVRWFELSTGNADFDRRSQNSAWLESAADAIYDSMADAGGKYHHVLHECYNDLGSFGTAIKFTWVDPKSKSLFHRSLPLQSCWIAENSSGQIDTLFREVKFTTRQAIQEFGEDKLPKCILDEKDWNKKWSFVHALYPRNERHLWKPPTKENMEVASVYVFKDEPEICGVDGFRSFPCQCPRWSKLPGETYGRSPAMDCLALVRVLNSAQKILLQSSALAAAPPIVVDNDGVIAPLVLEPWGLIRKETGATVEPLQLNGNIAVNINLIQNLQAQIRSAFMADLFSTPDFGNRDRVTAEEVYQKRDDRMRNVSPMLGRIENELLNPDIERQYNLLVENGRIPLPPPGLKNQRLKISNISPAFIAQRSIRGMAIQRLLSTMIPLTQFRPDLMDKIDIEVGMEELAQAFNVTRRAIRTSDDVASIRQAREQQNQAAQLTGMAPQVAGALKDVAIAAEKSPQLLSMLPAQ